jgi:hypothetical protein
MPADAALPVLRSPPGSAAPPTLALAAAGLLALVSGCGRDDLTHFRVPKEAVQAAVAGAGAGGPAAMAGDVAPPPTPSGAAALRWKLPKGWKQAEASPPRFASLVPPVPGKIDASVVVLQGPAGGELANVNRWRGQIGLPPLTDASLASARRSQKTKVGDVAIYDFVSSGTVKTRTVAGFTVVEGNTWFFKMTGDDKAVESARPTFLELIGSIDRD